MGKKLEIFFLILKPSKEKILFFLFCHQRKKIQKNIFFFQETNWKFSFRRKIFYCQEIFYYYYFCSVKLSRNLFFRETKWKNHIHFWSMEVLKLPVNWSNLLERIEANKPEFVCLECVLKRISVFSDFCTRCQNTQYTGSFCTISLLAWTRPYFKTRPRLLTPQEVTLCEVPPAGRRPFQTLSSQKMK